MFFSSFFSKIILYRVGLISFTHGNNKRIETTFLRCRLKHISFVVKAKIEVFLSDGDKTETTSFYIQTTNSLLLQKT
jgi:hypothetical protein